MSDVTTGPADRLLPAAIPAAPQTEAQPADRPNHGRPCVAPDPTAGRSNEADCVAAAISNWARHLPVDDFDVQQCLDQINATERWLGRIQAVRATLLARVAQLRPDEADQTVSRYAADEIATELAWSRGHARRQLDCAQALTARLPATHDALYHGAIDWYTADAIRQVTAHVADAATVRAVEDRALAGDPANRTSGEIRARARRAVLDLDPDAAARHQRARGERRIRLVAKDDGMAGLWALLPAEQAVAAHRHIDALARHAATPDDGRSADQRRADAFCDLVLGRSDRLSVRVNVTVPAATLAGGDKPGEIDGYGPVDAETARRLASGRLSDDTTWRRLLTDPVSSRVLDVGRRRYRPPAALADQVAARDQTCVFPGCMQPASECQLDHTVAWEDGGGTDAANLAPLCPHHHRLKHEAGWTLTQVSPGSFVWRSPTGHVRCSGSPPIDPFDGPPRDEADRNDRRG